ncbi:MULTISPECIES: helix-turn-helix domain-containing protein [unclassified Pedobacter]|uniref:helix-turn-helix domain-containing protein n=1 Tax=unclassified Pedobacter TaxID=2628915 RepID=UPI001423B76E|nr:MULTISPECIES: helix-turn-helix domain-containing protein [unclassified Pedobacter]NII84280.1 AraC-like DNA-binding protein [Pedobacter sp. SG908]NMN38805.1 AraC-like DNA-binding protein [Pedobacter sp. SG918]
MKNFIKDIPKYDLKNFKTVHRENEKTSPFGYNLIQDSKIVRGFEMYSSEGLVNSIGPLKSDFYRISITVKGSLDMKIGLENFRHQPLTLAFTFPNQIFSKKNIASDAFGYYILFNSDFLNDIIPAIKIADEFPFYHSFGKPVFQVAAEELDVMLELLMKINDELQGEKVGREKAIKIYLYLLLLEAKRSYKRQQLEDENGDHPESYKLTNRFKKLVGLHYLTKRQVADYAEMCGVSPNHLNRTVKENLGITASEAIKEMLLQEAKLLLRYTDNSVAEIAYKLNFTEPASFNRFFKSISGETPLVFRKMNN